MTGKRTGIDFSTHELFITQKDDLLIHYLKKPETNCDSIKFINTNGILAVTGDFGNWIFCREFHPSADGYVSGGYWIEKLENSSCQVPSKYDGDATAKEIERLLKEEDDLDEKEREYLTDLLDCVHDEVEYTYRAYRENVGRFEDYEYIPFEKELNIWLKIIFDGFEEICRRISIQEPIKEALTNS